METLYLVIKQMLRILSPVVKIESSHVRRKSEIKINALLSVCTPRGKASLPKNGEKFLHHGSPALKQKQLGESDLSKIHKKVLPLKPFFQTRNADLFKKVLCPISNSLG